MALALQSLSDSQLLDTAQHALAEFQNNLGEYIGITNDHLADLGGKVDTFSDDLSGHIGAQATAKAATTKKDVSRTLLEKILRSMRTLAIASGTKEDKIDALGLPEVSQAAPSNATIPDIEVETKERMRHTIHWRDTAAQDTKRKPRGVMGAEIWVKIGGDPPIDEKERTFLTLDAFTPYLAEYDGEHAGKMAHYLVRWRLRDGSVSAWSETGSATITG
jgi:hypothetical protein